ncbi:olfactomedin-like protein 2A [Xenia sp. Carnegie-2017]|uniref:olfactomedin-like protein 2A n=1 Tax=Xenia sp. Carnegie-2017 TaxID=2897299 RepID=UPI001F048788|nr:olfactomedin-like protein 2A [Xenia sp. Carnegie-2017]
MYFFYFNTFLSLLVIGSTSSNGKIIESSKNEKEFTKTASELLANADQNVETQSDDEKRTLNRRTTKQSIANLYLELAKAYILEAALKKGKALTSLVYLEDNCKKIKKVGEPIVHHHSGKTQGAWMKDPLGLLGAKKIWYINGYHGNKVLEFEDMDHFKAGKFLKHILPYNIAGTGSVVYGRYLYFHRSGTCNVVQYDLEYSRVSKQACPNSNIKSGQYSYQWGGYSGVDLSVDESGLWVLWAYKGYSGKLCATLMDPLTLRTLSNYYGISSESKTSMGNAFVACGIVYSIDSCHARSTAINYAYDVGKRTGSNPNIKFTNKFGYNSMVTYNPREKVLYAWDRHRQITYPLEFEK